MSRLRITSALVLAKIAGPECGVYNQVRITAPLSGIFQGVSAPLLWLVKVSRLFPEVPEGVLFAAPDDSFASVADRIAEYLNS